MKQIAKIFSLSALVLLVSFGAYKLWDKYINYNFGVVTEEKVYKSAAIEPSKLEEFITKNNIKTVIDFRKNSKNTFKLEDEERVIKGIEGTNYYNIKSKQVPTEKDLKEFYSIMDDESNYPVLLHCYHGLGRTMLYVSLYRIEYEGMDNDLARSKTRPYVVDTPFYKSSFAPGKPKGDFLLSYTPREKQDDANISR